MFPSLSRPLPLPLSLSFSFSFSFSLSLSPSPSLSPSRVGLLKVVFGSSRCAEFTTSDPFGQFTWTAAYRTGSRSRSGKVSGCTVTGLNTVIRLRCRTCLFGRCPGPAVLTGSRPLSKCTPRYTAAPCVPRRGFPLAAPVGSDLPVYLLPPLVLPYLYLRYLPTAMDVSTTLLYLPPTCTFLQLHTSSRRQVSTRLSRSSLPMTIYNLSSEGLHFHSTPLH